MSSSEEDEYAVNSKFYFWNDWQPQRKNERRREVGSQEVSCSQMPASNLKCWLPPRNFGLYKNVTNKSWPEVHAEEPVTGCNATQVGYCSAPANDQEHSWGPRMSHGSSYSDLDEGEITWNIFDAGVFGNFKLWFNEYRQILAYADAEVTNGFDSEKMILLITDVQLLRKLLRASPEEWAALIEILGQTKINLKYETLKPQVPVNNKQPLHKLWNFLCKRRHFLPCVSLRMRRTGVQKITQYLKILPKFTVVDIRTCDGGDLF